MYKVMADSFVAPIPYRNNVIFLKLPFPNGMIDAPIPYRNNVIVIPFYNEDFLKTGSNSI